MYAGGYGDPFQGKNTDTTGQYGGILSATVVSFPLMYRTARGAFESFDETLAYSGQTLGLSDSYIFWHIRMPSYRQGILAGMVLAFACALGEYGATSMLIGYTPGKTATILTTMYQLWRINDNQGAFSSYCPKCKQENLIDAKELHITIIKQ